MLEKKYVIYDNGFIKLIGKQLIDYTNENKDGKLELMSLNDKLVNNLIGAIYIIPKDFELYINEKKIDNHIEFIDCMKINDYSASFQYYKTDRKGLNYINIDKFEAKVTRKYSELENIEYNLCNLNNEDFEKIDKIIRSMVDNYLAVTRYNRDKHHYLRIYDEVYREFFNQYIKNVAHTNCLNLDKISSFQDVLLKNNDGDLSEYYARKIDKLETDKVRQYYKNQKLT